MVASSRRFSVSRCLAVAVIAFGLAIPVPSAAQRRDKAEAYAFLTFLQSIAAQRTARFCERGVPGYRQRFDSLYTRWSDKHREMIARGERVFREAISNKDRPDTDYAKLEQIETI